MLIHNSLQQGIKTLSLTTSVSDALSLMNEYSLQHLPIVENNYLLGMLSKSVLSEAIHSSKTVADLPFETQTNGFVLEDQLFLEAVLALAEKKWTAIPVLSQEHTYVGIITLQTVIAYLAELAATQQPGGVLVLDLLKRNYALSEIARIAETADAKILLAYVSLHPDTERMYLHIRFNTEELSRVVASLERYGYEISYVKQANTELYDTADRMEALLKFLNI